MKDPNLDIPINKEEKIFFYLRTCLCIVLTLIWTSWVVNLPNKTANSNQQSAISNQLSAISYQKPKVETLKPPNLETLKPHNLPTPKLQNLEIPKPKALSTQHSALSSKLKAPIQEVDTTKLREPINTKSKKEIKLETELESWLPRYILATKDISPKIEQLNKNLDTIINHIEVTGLLKNTSGESQAIIIKNNLNNKIEILKKGDEYSGLKVLDINKDEVIFINQSLNKQYAKKITSIK
ncbi:MAG: hypothetical protein HYY52_06915 [Candidatus Melainabacteria bacterium]|nr:hypothetical protein [Candidatus Melainabacteria bacterium]